MATSLASCESIWIHKLVEDLSNENLESIVIYYDSKICIILSRNIDFHDFSKHINMWYHFLSDKVQ